MKSPAATNLLILARAMRVDDLTLYGNVGRRAAQELRRLAAGLIAGEEPVIKNRVVEDTASIHFPAPDDLDEWHDCDDSRYDPDYIDD